MFSYAAFTLSKRTALIFILVFTAIIIFDSTIVDFASYSGVELPTSLLIGIFIIFSIVFAANSVLLINSIRKEMSRNIHEPIVKRLRYFHVLISTTLSVTIAIILIIIFQMILMNKYSLILLNVQIYLSHISALVFLSSLVFLFSRWLTLKKTNFPTILYPLSFLLASVNLVVSLVYLNTYLSSPRFRELPYATAYPMTSYVTQLQGLPFTESLSVAFDVLSLFSFLLMWIATAISLSQYRHRMGKIKYYSLMTIPLIYYVFPLQGYFGDVLFNLLQSSPISYSIIYILIFSATKQVGAVLFSLAFWTASTLVYDNRIRKSLLMSSIGVAILFGTFEISPLQYHIYPPFGFITQAFIPLGAYLLFVGIFSSAKVISRDSVVRKEFYRSASSQLSLLKSIGVSEMEKELEKQIKSVEEKVISSETGDDIPQLEEENVKEILHEVLDELYYSKNKK